MHGPCEPRHDIGQDCAIELAEDQPLGAARRAGDRADRADVEAVAPDRREGAGACLEAQGVRRHADAVCRGLLEGMRLDDGLLAIRPGGNDLEVLLLGEDQQEVGRLKSEVRLWLGQRDLMAQYSWLPQPTAGALIGLVRAAADCVLVLGGDNPLLEASSIQELLDETDCPVLLVR